MLDKRSTAEAVFELLKERIEREELRPGDALPSERELQRELGISRISLREGLARLTALGIIEVAHGKGAVVARSVRPEVLESALMPLLDRDDSRSIDELYEARAMIESEIAGMAAERRDGGAVAALRENLQAAEAALEDESEFVRLDLRFHQVLAQAAGNRYLLVMRAAIEASTRKLVRIHGSDAAKRSAVLERHRRMVVAVESGDSREARALARAHLAQARRG